MGAVILFVLLIIVGIAMLIGRAVGARPNPAFPLAVIGVLVIAFTWPPGWIDVQIACRRDGGLRGTAPKLEGFWYDGGGVDIDCEECKQLVVDRRFRYVDYRAEKSWAPLGIVKGQFYRVTHGPTSDAECKPPDRYLDIRSVPPGCVVTTPVPEALRSDYRYSWSFSDQDGVLGHRLWRENVELTAVSTGHVVLRYRRYAYTTPLTRWLSGGTEDSIYECPHNSVGVDQFKTLFSAASIRE